MRSPPNSSPCTPASPCTARTAFTDLIGDSVLSLSNLMFSVFEPKEQRRLCALIVDYTMMRLVAAQAMRRAIFSREGFRRVMKGTVLELAGFEPDDTGPWTDEEQHTIVETGLGRMKDGQTNYNVRITEKYRHCLEESIIEISDFGLTPYRADPESEARARELYRDVTPFLAWIAANLQPCTDAEGIEAAEHLHTLIASVLAKYGPSQ